MSYSVQVANAKHVRGVDDAAHFIPCGGLVMSRVPPNTVCQKPPILECCTVAEANAQIFDAFFKQVLEFMSENAGFRGDLFDFDSLVHYGMDAGSEWRPIGVNKTQPSKGVTSGTYVPYMTDRMIHVKTEGPADTEHIWGSSVTNGDWVFLQLRFVLIKGGVQLYDFGGGRRVKCCVPDEVMTQTTRLYAPQWVAMVATNQKQEMSNLTFNFGGPFSYTCKSVFVGVVADNNHFSARREGEKRLRMGEDEYKRAPSFELVCNAVPPSRTISVLMFMQ